MKKILLLSCVLLILPIGFLFISYYNKEYKVIESEKQSKTIVNSNALTMMYETGPDTGEYQVSSDTTWPQEGYVFNEQLSACENGSTLTWDDESKKVLLQASTSDKCYVYFDVEPPPTLADVCAGGENLASCIKNYNTTYSNGIGGLYHHDGTITKTNCMYNDELVASGIEDETVCQEVYYNAHSKKYLTAGGLSEVLWDSEKEICKTTSGTEVVYNQNGDSGVLEGDCTGYAQADVGTTCTYPGGCSSFNYTTIVKSVGSGTIEYEALDAVDGSYRYSGANPNNYVCFGSDAATCPNDNLYRIIGVFENQVKLIKYDYANSDLLGTDGDYSNKTYTNTSSSDPSYKGTKTEINLYYWNLNTRENIWSESELNTVNLNVNYLNNIGSTWANKIATTNWIVGGNTDQNIYNVAVKSTYTNEIVSPAESTTYNAKIGLMYVSDYGYATSPENWTKNLNIYHNDTIKNNNWMFMGLDEWTITRFESLPSSVFLVRSSGSVGSNSVNYGYDYKGVRPAFYLNSDITYISGSGTESDPFRIA